MYNKAADFKHYKTFSITATPEFVLYENAEPYVEVFNQAIIKELEKKGYAYAAEGGDLFVNYRAEVDNQLENFDNAIPITPDRFGYYRSWASLYGPLPQETEGGDTRISYIGSLNIDIVDAEHQQAVWQGVYQRKITSDSIEARRQLINDAVHGVLTSLPKGGH